MVEYIHVELVFGLDKQMHFFSFFFVSLFWGTVLLLITPIRYSRRNLSLLWFSIILIGIVEEYRQYEIPDRSTEFLDAMANMLGASCGLLFPILVSMIYKQNAATKHLYLLYMTTLTILSFGLWELNQEPFLRGNANVSNIIRGFFVWNK